MDELSQISLPSRGTEFSCDDALAFVGESKTIGFAIADLECKFRCVNLAYCRILDALPQHIIGTTFMQWTHEDDVAADVESAKQLIAGDSLEYAMAKRYIKRGHTKKIRREVWGLLEVTAVWNQDQCQYYRVKFTPWAETERLSTPLVTYGTKLVGWLIKNWKPVAIALGILLSIFGGSDALLKVLSAIREAGSGVDSVLQPLSPTP